MILTAPLVSSTFLTTKLEFGIDDICVEFGVHICQQLVLYRKNNTTGAYFFQKNILTALKDGIQSYWNKVYPRSSFSQMWILNYWIFWIILTIVLFQKFSLSKHVTFLHFTNNASLECIKTFKNIIKDAVIFKIVRNVTNL